MIVVCVRAVACVCVCFAMLRPHMALGSLVCFRRWVSAALYGRLRELRRLRRVWRMML